MDWITFILGLIVFSSGGLLLMKIIQFFKFYKEDISSIETEKTHEFLGAKQVYVRDPNDFKDKDKDGIDDIIDPKI